MVANRLVVALGAGLVLWGWAAKATGGPAPSTQPVEGLRENTAKVHALTGARIVVSPEQAIERGTIVLRDGVIEAVGPDVQITPDARL